MSMNIEQVVSAPRIPWQNQFIESIIDTIRWEYFDHIIVLGRSHLISILSPKSCVFVAKNARTATEPSGG